MLKSIAVLIDADNINSQKIDWIFEQIKTLGTITTKRIYGDFAKPHLSSWESAILKYAIEKKHQTSYSTGKNSSDIALAIDAMDLLYSKECDGFAIISSDSDFIGLALRIRKNNIPVFGFGGDKTIKEFTYVCDKFFEIPTQKDNDLVLTNNSSNNILKENNKIVKNQIVNSKIDKPIIQNNTKEPVRDTGKISQLSGDRLKNELILINAIKDSIAKNINKETGYTEFSKFTQYLKENYPQIKVSNYGYSKWRSLVNQIDFFEIKSVYDILCIRTKVIANQQVDLIKKPVVDNNQKIITKKLKEKIMKMIQNAPQCEKDRYGYTELPYIERQLKIMGVFIEEYNCKDIKSFLKKLGCILRD